MRLPVPACALLLLIAVPAAADTLDRVRAEGVLHCGGVIRPGLDFPAVDGTWHGLEIDICRAAAAAVLGAPDAVTFDPYILPKTYDPIHNGGHPLFFLTASEILAAHLLGTVLPVLPVFYETHRLMVPADSPAQAARDLAGQQVCVEPGTGPERSLLAFSKRTGIDLKEFPFQESDEMIDAFAVGRCAAIAQEVTALAGLRLQDAAEGGAARILPDILAVVPVFAATGVDDGRWSAIVSWTVQTLVHAEPGQSGDAASLPLDGRELGLAGDWQARALAAAGDYAAIYDRNLGQGSPLALPRGLNAAWSEHGLLAAPTSE